MKIFIFKILLFFGLFWIGDRFVVQVLEYFRPIDYKIFIDSKRKIFKENEHYDLLIIGDSHVSDALDTRVLDERLNLKSFNLGVYHASPYEWYYLLKACLAHLDEKPKYLIIGTNPDMFFREQDVGKYTPVIVNNLNVQYHLYKNSTNGLDLSFFCYSLKQSYLFLSIWNKIMGKEYLPTRKIKSSYSGYLETLNHNPTGEWSTDDSSYKKMYEIQIKFLEETILLAQQNGLEVYVVNSPIWRELQASRNRNRDFKQVQATVHRLIEKRKVLIFNENYLFGFWKSEKNEFLNPEHLNSIGAKQFTNEVCDWIESRKSN